MEKCLSAARALAGPLQGIGALATSRQRHVRHCPARYYRKLRDVRAEGLAGLDLKGMRVGGRAVGEPQNVDGDADGIARMSTCSALPGEQAALPDGRRHAWTTMLKSVGRAFDMFIALMPTRAGPPRPGLHPPTARSNIKEPRHAEDHRPLDEPKTSLPRRARTIPAPIATIWSALTRFWH